MWARREWNDIFKLIKEGNLQSRILYPARLLFGFYGEIKSFTDKKRLKEFSTTKSALTPNVKGTYIVKKYKRRKRSTKSTSNN